MLSNLTRPLSMLPRLSTPSRLFGYLGLALGGVIGTVLYSQYEKDLNHYYQVNRRLVEKEPTMLQGENTQFYPWALNLRQWEGKKVSLEGFFKEQRFFVTRTRQGKQGYLVLAPFVTKSLRANPNPAKRRLETTIMVCLGWVEKGDKNEKRKGLQADPVPLIEYKQQTHPNFLLIDDSFNRDPENEMLYMPLTRITAYVRPTEQRNLLKGYNNWIKEKVFRYIDLYYIVRRFNIPNVDSARVAYLQLVNEQQQASTVPIPMTPQLAVVEHVDKHPSLVSALWPAVGSTLGAWLVGAIMC